MSLFSDVLSRVVSAGEAVLSGAAKPVEVAAEQEVTTEAEPVLDEVATAADSEVTKLTDEGLDVLTKVVAPKLDVPSYLLPLVTGEATTLASDFDHVAQAEIEMVVARAKALLPTVSASATVAP
jgi:hypothetical protein